MAGRPASTRFPRPSWPGRLRSLLGTALEELVEDHPVEALLCDGREIRLPDQFDDATATLVIDLVGRLDPDVGQV